MSRLHRAAALVPLVAVVALAPAPAAASTRADGVHDLPSVSDAELRESVGDLEGEVDSLSLEVEDVERVARQGAETVVRLRTDVLFAFGAADLPAAAERRITELVSDVPRSAEVGVFGHTDGIGTDRDNLRLSQARAAAVAAVVRAARPDLRLDVRGFGEAQPVEPNERGGEDNPQGRTQNRRVELRY